MRPNYQLMPKEAQFRQPRIKPGKAKHSDLGQLAQGRFVGEAAIR